jgi:hypothetical protein
MHTNPINSIHFGILGCANIAIRSLMPAIAAHPACRLAAVASRDQAKAAPLAAQYACRAVSYDELVADPAIDAVYVPLPTGLHFEWVMKALAAGKHVLCEKSLGCTADEVRQMVELARRKHLLLMETFQFRFHSQHAVVKELLASGLLGEIRCFRSSFGFPPFADGARNIRYQKALGGGALLDAGAYTIKAATFMLSGDFNAEAQRRRGGEGCFNAEAQRRRGGEGCFNAETQRRRGGEGNADCNLALHEASCKSCNPGKNNAETFRVKAATLRYTPEHEVDVGGAICLEHASGVPIQTAFGFDNFYQCNYEIWGSRGKLTAKRAFTAPPGFAPEIVIETAAGAEVRTLPPDDHFANMLTHFTATIRSGAFDAEYQECLTQADLLGQALELAGD